MGIRLIDADALDKRIYNDIPISFFGSVKRMAAIRTMVEEEPTVTPEPGWISVEDRLPEDDLPPDTDRVAIKVLTVTKHGTRRFVRELTRQRWEWHGVMQPWSWSKDAIGVTHWMPLPEPPKEDA